MSSNTQIVLAAGTALAMSSMAFGQHVDSFANVQSDGVADVRNTVAPAFTVGSISWQGTNLNSNGSGSFLSELNMNVTSPTSGPVDLVDFGLGTTWSGNRNISGWSAAFAGEAAAGNWEFSFSESFDDAAVPDAAWGSADVFIDNSVLPSFAATQTVNGPAGSYPLAAGGLTWVTFTHAGGQLSISTAGSTNTGGSFADNDTEIGLFDASGLLIDTNDDEDFGNNILTSRLDFANLPAGTYGVAVGAFNTSYADGYVITDHTSVGTSIVTITPTPGTAALFGIAGLAGIRRRR